MVNLAVGHGFGRAGGRRAGQPVRSLAPPRKDFGALPETCTVREEPQPEIVVLRPPGGPVSARRQHPLTPKHDTRVHEGALDKPLPRKVEGLAEAVLPRLIPAQPATHRKSRETPNARAYDVQGFSQGQSALLREAGGVDQIVGVDPGHPLGSAALEPAVQRLDQAEGRLMQDPNASVDPGALPKKRGRPVDAAVVDENELTRHANDPSEAVPRPTHLGQAISNRDEDTHLRRYVPSESW